MTHNLKGSSPFPPVLFARRLHTLVAEQYVSSSAVSALILLDPPISAAAARRDYPEQLPTKLDEFDFEPRFNVKIAWSAEELERQRKAGHTPQDLHRIERALEVRAVEDRTIWQDVDVEGPKDIVNWLEEECGV